MIFNFYSKQKFYFLFGRSRLCREKSIIVDKDLCAFPRILGNAQEFLRIHENSLAFLIMVLNQNKLQDFKGRFKLVDYLATN